MPRRIGFADDIRPEDLALRGEHNLENARAATAAARGMGVDEAALREALREFAGVPHRLEEVGRVDGVLYVNDSKATNVASAVRGPDCLPRAASTPSWAAASRVAASGACARRRAAAARCT